mmetsp:Transcript_7960/g.11581  ORF Transcript_7960/g.11581 Transcript_7960/m.11581 type:complete len:186 (+) Transcript_7960:2-559(+)
MSSSQSSSNKELLNLPIRLTSTVIPGFGRGSTDLGIPTANLSREHLTCNIPYDNLPCGIYWGFARIGNNNTNNNASELGRIHKAAISIGYNPTYNNTVKTIEPHLIASRKHPCRHSSKCGETLFGDFYGEKIRVSVVGYLRPELPFEGLEKLIEAIKGDIVQSEMLGEGEDELVRMEKAWVESED